MVVQRNISREKAVKNATTGVNSHSRSGELNKTVRNAPESTRPAGFASGRMPTGDPPDLTLWGSDEWGKGSSLR